MFFMLCISTSSGYGRQLNVICHLDFAAIQASKSGKSVKPLQQEVTLDNFIKVGLAIDMLKSRKSVKIVQREITLHSFIK